MIKEYKEKIKAKKLHRVRLKSCLITIYINTKTNQKFSSILLHASLWHVYHMTKAVQAVIGTQCD